MQSTQKEGLKAVEQQKSGWFTFFLSVVVILIVGGVWTVVINPKQSQEYKPSDSEQEISYPTFYTQTVANVRDCKASSCAILAQLPANSALALPYNSIEEMPDWVQVDWGGGRDGYVSKLIIGLNSVTTVGGGNAQQDNMSTNKYQTQTPSVSDLPSVVKEWSSRVVRIQCSDNNYTSSGSGVITRVNFPKNYLSDMPTIVTNKHVVTDPSTGKPYWNCTFEVPGYPLKYTLSMVNEIQDNQLDVAFFPSIGLIGSFPESKTSMRLCSSNIDLGEKIAILGYPANGGTGDAASAITVTQGIISSFDGMYYVTDAKIDHGNSGGIAISIKEDCFLGIPTWAESGGFESFGRILAAPQFIQNSKGF